MDYFSAGQRNFFTKVKIILSSFFNFLLCSSSFQKHNQNPVLQDPLLPFSISGLKALISSEQPQFIEGPVIRSAGIGILRSNLLTHYSSSSSSSFCSSIRSCNFLMDDWIGTESGVCLTSNSEEIQHHSDFDFLPRHNFTVQNQRCVSKKKFPPPIPSVAVQRAGNRPRSPWMLTRHCSNRRLILKLERVTHHQSLESRRENGRLILNLVRMEDDPEDVESIECEGGGGECEIGIKSFTYCGENGNLEERHVVDGHLGSAPLVRRMGTSYVISGWY